MAAEYCVLGQLGVATARTRQQRPAKASVESSARLHVRGSSSPHMNISAASSEMSARNAVTRACACSMGASARDAVVYTRNPPGSTHRHVANATLGFARRSPS